MSTRPTLLKPCRFCGSHSGQGRYIRQLRPEFREKPGPFPPQAYQETLCVHPIIRDSQYWSSIY